MRKLAPKKRLVETDKARGPVMISGAVHSRLRKYCGERGLIMSKLVSSIITEHLDRISFGK